MQYIIYALVFGSGIAAEIFGSKAVTAIKAKFAKVETAAKAVEVDIKKA